VSLVDKIEELGAAVDAGLLDRAQAVQMVVEYSEGELTHYGAGTQIDAWQTRRAAYADIFMSAEMGIAACESAIRRQGGAR
jgi:hypothetical protein